MAAKRTLQNISNGVSPKKQKIDESSNSLNRFLFGGQDYSRQFFNLYTYRLAEMTSLLKKKVIEKWGTEIPVKKLCELREGDLSKCILIGTIFKHQKLKPSILRDISEENQLAPQPPRTYYVSENDKLILEDELQRIRLIGKIEVHNLVTGIVCAVKGYVESDGFFEVEDIIFYESGPQKPLKELNDSPIIVLISGFDQSTASLHPQSVETLQKWLNGKLKNYENAKKISISNVVRIIFAGNSIRSTPEPKINSLQAKKTDVPKTVGYVKDFDKWISESCTTIPIDIMPGEHDPSNLMLPQQPFHKCMFPLSSKIKNFKSTTNPYEVEISDRLILGTSGQNIIDITRTSKIEDTLEISSNIIKWSHIAPTCPDTLACYPYITNDPFILKQCPHIYFSGNMKEFKTKILEGPNSSKTRIICVPAFTETQSIVAVNLNTLDCEEISFKIKEE